MKALLLYLELLLVLVGIYLIATNLFPFAILLLFIQAWVSLRLRHLNWRSVGLKRPDHVLSTIAIALLVGCAYQALDTLAIAPLLQNLTGKAINLSLFAGLRGNLPVLIVSLILTWTEAAFIEEMFFRGYLFNRLTDLFGRKRLGILSALVAQAVLFALGHTYQGVSGVLDTALAGLLIGILYLRGRGNLWLPILTHGIIDTIGFLLIFLGWVS